MPARALRPAAPPPLLAWREMRELDGMRARRRDLQARIAALPRHAHRRVALEARLGELTAAIIASALELLRGAS